MKHWLSPTLRVLCPIARKAVKKTYFGILDRGTPRDILFLTDPYTVHTGGALGLLLVLKVFSKERLQIKKMFVCFYCTFTEA